jgi:hypothetical protein
MLVTIVLALATLGDATQVEMILIAKASRVAIFRAFSQAFLHTNLANVNEPYRYLVNISEAS